MGSMVYGLMTIRTKWNWTQTLTLNIRTKFVRMYALFCFLHESRCTCWNTPLLDHTIQSRSKGIQVIILTSFNETITNIMRVLRAPFYHLNWPLRLTTFSVGLKLWYNHKPQNSGVGSQGRYFIETLTSNRKNRIQRNKSTEDHKSGAPSRVEVKTRRFTVLVAGRTKNKQIQPNRSRSRSEKKEREFF